MPSSTDRLHSAATTSCRPPCTHRSRRLLVCGLLVAAALIAPAIHAEPKSFKSSYGAGKTALQTGAFQEALDHFRQSLRDAGEHQAASWKGMIGVAYAFRGLEEPGYALEYYRRFLEQSAVHLGMLPPKWRARHEAVQAEVDELENQAMESHALVAVASAPPGAQLAVDGLNAGADGTATTPYPLYLAPGEHMVTLSLVGHAEVTKTFTVSAGDLVPVSVTLMPVAATAPVLEKAPPVKPPPEFGVPLLPITSAEERGPGVGLVDDQKTGSSHIGPIVLLSAAGAVAMAAIGLTVGAEMKNRDLEEWERHYATLSVTDRQQLTGLLARDAESEGLDLASSRDGMQLGSTICYTLGVSAAIGGLIWLMMGEADEDTAAVDRVPAIGFVPTDDGGTTSATWRF